MKINRYIYLLVCLFLKFSASWADNQTAQLSPVIPATGLPFTVKIEEAGFQLPVGFHSGVVGEYQGQWVFIGGSTIGLHGFGLDPFPPQAQNRSIYVVNPLSGLVKSRSLTDPGSGVVRGIKPRINGAGLWCNLVQPKLGSKNA